MTDQRTFVAVATIGALTLAFVVLIAIMLVVISHELLRAKKSAKATLTKVLGTRNVISELVTPIVQTVANTTSGVARRRRGGGTDSDKSA
jgi:hypothetical protein